MEENQLSSGILNDTALSVKYVKLTAGDKNQELEPQGEIILKFDIQNLTWTREPKRCVITQDRIEIVTKPHTDLW